MSHQTNPKLVRMNDEFLIKLKNMRYPRFNFKGIYLALYWTCL